MRKLIKTLRGMSRTRIRILMAIAVFIGAIDVVVNANSLFFWFGLADIVLGTFVFISVE